MEAFSESGLMGTTSKVLAPLASPTSALNRFPMDSSWAFTTMAKERVNEDKFLKPLIKKEVRKSFFKLT